ncbi:MAG: helical backbone metal receptor [Candidatus Aminicenantes bacterium]|nr:helical backbone metal receptor [Candidatus Aminicenantes bacterium]
MICRKCSFGWIGKVCLFLFFLIAAELAFPQRVVSLAPGLTEIVFALGKEEALVGVTKFCDYPPAAANIKKIGGFLDVNIEALISLDPDTILMYPEHYDKMGPLKKQARLVVVRHSRLADLLQSIIDIGRALNAEVEAEKLVSSIRNKLQNVSDQVKGLRKIRTIFIAGRNIAELKNMYIIGKNDFINDLLEISGGTNAYEGSINYPSISIEAVIFLNPEFIFEISAHYQGISADKIFDLWKPYDMIQAVAKKQIKLIKNSFWLRPGPRVGLIADELVGFFQAGQAAEN